MTYTKDFYVIAKSSNTNSFGLYQMVVVALDGTAYKTCASMYNVKEKGQVVGQTYSIDPKTGQPTGHHFVGHELTEKIEDCPKDVLYKFLWELLGDVPCNDAGEIDEKYLDFEKGVDREEIWTWFEETFNISVAEDLIYVK